MKRLAALLIALALAPSARSAPPNGAAAARPNAAGSPRDLAADPPAGGTTPMPARSEWSGGSEATPARPLPTGCEARIVREWLRLRCGKRRFASVGVISGDAKDVALWLESGKDEGFAEFILPLRAGDRRILQVTELATDALHASGQQRLAFIVSEQWPAGDPGPTVAVLQSSS